jgi:NB-ARC domain
MIIASEPKEPRSDVKRKKFIDPEGYFLKQHREPLGDRLQSDLRSIVSDLIVILTGERPPIENLNSAVAKFGEALGDRRILLVIDDAWREQDLRPFLEGGRNTTRLVTTRRDDILPLDAERQVVDAMQGEEALALLAQGLPEDQAARQRQALEKLAARLGEWPQLLKLVNGFLRDRVVKSRQALEHSLVSVNRCRPICRGRKSSSSPKARPVLVVEERCMSWARTAPSGWTSSQLSSK